LKTNKYEFLINYIERDYKMGDKGKKDQDKKQKQKTRKQAAIAKKKQEKNEQQNFILKKL